jgi:hypothetical protein
MVTIYERALEILDRFGWQQGTYGQPGGRVCVSGALRQAASCDDEMVVRVQMVPEWSAARRELARGLRARHAAWQLAAMRLSRMLGQGGGGVIDIGDSLLVQWNDTPGRTLEEVRAALKQAAGELEDPSCSEEERELAQLMTGIDSSEEVILGGPGSHVASEEVILGGPGSHVAPFMPYHYFGGL